jgi:hypothetical protein
MPLHLDEFQREEFQGYVESVPPAQTYPLARFYPDKPVFDTEFAYNVVSGGYGQMASITAWDAGAPLRDKDVLARMTGELGKMQHSFRLTEKELLMYNRPRMEEEQKQVVQAVYDNTDKLVYGTYDREEWLRAKATYEGALTYDENGVVLDIDFLIPAENKIAVTTAWASGVEVLADLQLAVQAFKDANNGEAPAEMHMSGRVESLLLQNSQIKSQVYGNATDGRIVTSEQLRGVFNALDIPNYVVVNRRVRGDAGMEDLMPNDRIVFVADQLGRTLQGPTVENDYKPGVYVIPQIQETNPPRQDVFVGKASFPALERPSAIVHLIVTP